MAEELSKPLKIGMIGCGKISRSHMRNILTTPAVHLVATMDLVQALAEERAEEGHADYSTTDLERVLDDPNIEAVMICSSHHTHTELVLQANAAGKHVFCEKPLAMTLADARRIQEAAHRSGLHVMSGWWFKHSPMTARLREVITNPYFIFFTCRLASTRYENATPNHPDGPYGTNGILDAAGYNLHWIWHVMRSQPIEIYAAGFDGKPTNTSTIVIRFANGGVGTSIYSVIGSGGIVPKHYAEVLAGPVSAAISAFRDLVFEGTDAPGLMNETRSAGFDRQLGMFANLCRNGGKNPMDAWEAAIPTLIFERAVESMQTGQPVPVNLEEAFYLPDGKLPTSVTQFGD